MEQHRFSIYKQRLEKIELNNESIALNILYVPHKTRKICLAYKSKHNLAREEQVILLMITNVEKWHYTSVTRLSGLLRGVTGNNNGDFYCLNCFHAYRTKNKLEIHKKICENHDYWHVEMPNEDNKIIKYNQGEKSIKSSFIIYTPSGYSLFTHCSFDKTKNKLDYYRGKDCMKKF